MTDQPATPPTPSPAPAPPPPRGRRYGFGCSYCSSRLEAVDSLAGQSGTCPTCGNAIIIPILDAHNRLIDPTSGKIIKQDPHPVHAYAAAGRKAPLIITVDATGDRFILCPRCQRQNALASNNCLGCGLPFTMEGTLGDSLSGTNTWAVASLVMGIIGLAAFCVVVPPPLAVIFGFLALRTGNNPSGQSTGQGMAIAGIVLGALGMLFTALMYARVVHF